MAKLKQMNRREFLRDVTAAAGAFAAPYVITSSALGGGGRPAASNRIVMGAIGVGGMGTGNLKSFLGRREVQMVAVCDVDLEHRTGGREKAKRIVDARYGNRNCAAYGDFRKITRRGDIDAVVISTPDHWHVLCALDAVTHGKDVYVEKPLSLTIREGRLLADAARRRQRVVQVGSQRRSNRGHRFACELARNGRLGKLHTVRVSIPGNNKKCGPTWRPEPVPKSLDYNMWLGPAPLEPYHRQRCHYTFRFILDYSGGQVTNWGAHFIDIAQWGLGMDHWGPVQISGKGRFPASGLFTTATSVNFECTYENGVRLICRTGGGETKFEGDRGWVKVGGRDGLRANPSSLLDERIGSTEIRLYESRDHRSNFLECIRTRRKPVADVEIGHRSATVCHLGNIAMLTGRKLRWDPKAERFINDAEADRMTSRAMRSPWAL